MQTEKSKVEKVEDKIEIKQRKMITGEVKQR